MRYLRAWKTVLSPGSASVQDQMDACAVIINWNLRFICVGLLVVAAMLIARIVRGN